MRYWAKILENENGGQSDMWQGEPWVVQKKDIHNTYTSMNMRAPPIEGKSTDEPSHAIKPHVTENCNAYMGL